MPPGEGTHVAMNIPISSVWAVASSVQVPPSSTLYESSTKAPVMLVPSAVKVPLMPTLRFEKVRHETVIVADFFADVSGLGVVEGFGSV